MLIVYIAVATILIFKELHLHSIHTDEFMGLKNIISGDLKYVHEEPSYSNEEGKYEKTLQYTNND